MHRINPRAALVSAMVALLVVAAPASAQETQDTAALPQALRTARTGLEAAYAKLDGAAASSHFAPTGAIDFGGQVISGRDAIRGWFGEMFANMSGLRAGAPKFVLGESEVSEKSTYVVALPDGSEQSGTSETVWRLQEDGTWKVVRLIVM